MNEVRRQHERYDAMHPVEAKCDTWKQFLRVYTQNISKGGMFLTVEDPPEVDTRLDLRFALPNGKILSIHARVVHSVGPEEAEEAGRPAGFGLEFDALTVEEEEAIEQLVELAKRHEAAPPPPIKAKG